MTSDDLKLIEIAWRLDRLRWVQRDALAELVVRDGRCVWAYTSGDPPPLTGRDGPDRELAARLCESCPVQDECLELELRTAGELTTGVWGALGEQDRRAVYRHWRERGERADELSELDGLGGERP
jgi:WhiB family redox-sensing transcriptional regulator